MPTQTRKTILFATDEKNSVLSAVDASKHNAFAYPPYGDSPQVAGFENLLRYNGELPDSMMHNYLLGNGYRIFNPKLMRFVSPDSNSFSPFGEGGLNYYSYCKNDPINRTDASGNLPGFIKSIARTFGLRRSAKAKLAERFETSPLPIQKSSWFSDNPAPIAELIYEKDINALKLKRTTNQTDFSFTTHTYINSKFEPTSGEALIKMDLKPDFSRYSEYNWARARPGYDNKLKILEMKDLLDKARSYKKYDSLLVKNIRRDESLLETGPSKSKSQARARRP
jgi:RHS repeat-associated protein